MAKKVKKGTEMTLEEWKKKVIEVQRFDAIGEPFIAPGGKLCFEWNGYTYGCMGRHEDPFVIPPYTAWQGIDRRLMKKYTGPPINWSQKITE